METMKQGMSLCYSKLSALFTEEELLVAEGLLDLGTAVVSTSSEPKLSWGRKRRRSSLLDAAAAGGPPPSSSRAPDQLLDGPTSPQLKLGPATAATTASPDTPLSFSPSESDDDKFRHSSSKKISKIRSRKELMLKIEELTQNRESLITEIEKVRKYYNRVKAENSEWKLKKQEVLKSRQTNKGSQSQMEKSKTVNRMMMNHGADSTQQQHYRIDVLPHHQQPFVADQKLQCSIGPITAQLYPCSNNGPASVNHVGPLGIPDLNISAEEAFGVDQSQPLDMGKVNPDKQARCAEARRMRSCIIRLNKIRSASGVKLPRFR